MKFKKYLFLVQLVILIMIGIFLLQSKEPIKLIENQQIDNISRQPKLMGILKLPYVIRYGENLWDIFRKHNVAKDDINLAIEEFKKIYNPRAIRAGDRYALVQDSLNQLVAYHYQPELATIYKIEKDSSENFTCKVDSLSFSKRIETLAGTIFTTLYESIIEQGGKPELIMSFTDIFQWDVDFFIEPQCGDSYKMVYEAFYLGDQFVKYGRVLAAQYNLSGNVMNAFYYDNDQGNSGYYDWDGQSFQKTFLKSPLNYRRISSYFSLGRRHPILKRIRPHYGVDFVANRGTPVVAPADGIVSEVGFQKGGVGRYLKIRHTNSHFETLFGHLSKYAYGIKKGVLVQQRQTIGYVGSTGLATGPHLHYTFYENGRAINPLRIRNVSADPLKPDKVEEYREDILPLLKSLSNISDGYLTGLCTQY